MSKLDSQTQEILIETLRVLVADESVQVEFTDEIQNNFFTWNQKQASAKRSLMWHLPAQPYEQFILWQKTIACFSGGLFSFPMMDTEATTLRLMAVS